MIARRAIVSGRVQGVGFRFFAERAARRAGVRGWVRNLEDGRVETVVEGKARCMIAESRTTATSFYTDEFHFLVADKFVECADGI